MPREVDEVQAGTSKRPGPSETHGRVKVPRIRAAEVAGEAAEGTRLVADQYTAAQPTAPPQEDSRAGGVDRGAAGAQAAWASQEGPSPHYSLPLLNFPLEREDIRWGQAIYTLAAPCDVMEAAIPANGRPLDARCLRPKGWLSTCVVDKLLEKFMDWADAPMGKVALADSATSYGLLDRLREEPEGPWLTQSPVQRRLQDKIKKHEVTLMPVCVEGHWAAVVFENRGTVGVVHVYNSILQYGRSILNRLLRMATRHYAGAGTFPVTWTIRHEGCAQQRNGHDCGLYTLAFLMEIGGRYACGYNPPDELQLPDMHHLRTRLAILLAEPLADWITRGGTRCF
jgi:hypothetical protein